MDETDKIKSLEERISNLKVTIKQLGNENTNKDIIIKELTEQVEKLKHDNLGMQLMLDKLKEDNNKLFSQKQLRVCSLDNIEDIIKDFGIKIEKLEKGVKEQEIATSNTDLTQLLKKLDDQLQINNNLRDKIDSYKEKIIHLNSMLDNQSNLIIDLKSDKQELENKIATLKSHEEELKLTQHLLDKKEDDLKEFKDRITNWNKWHWRILAKYRISVVIMLIAIILMALKILLKM